MKTWQWLVLGAVALLILANMMGFSLRALLAGVTTAPQAPPGQVGGTTYYPPQTTFDPTLSNAPSIAPPSTPGLANLGPPLVSTPTRALPPPALPIVPPVTPSSRGGGSGQTTPGFQDTAYWAPFYTAAATSAAGAANDASKLAAMNEYIAHNPGKVPDWNDPIWAPYLGYQYLFANGPPSTPHPA